MGTQISSLTQKEELMITSSARGNLNALDAQSECHQAELTLRGELAFPPFPPPRVPTPSWSPSVVDFWSLMALAGWPWCSRPSTLPAQTLEIKRPLLQAFSCMLVSRGFGTSRLK